MYFCALSLVVLQEKQAIIPEDDLGRDVATVEALQRKHEAFENELAALGSQASHSSVIFIVLKLHQLT